MKKNPILEIFQRLTDSQLKDGIEELFYLRENTEIKKDAYLMREISNELKERFDMTNDLTLISEGLLNEAARRWIKQIEPTDINKLFLDLMEGMERKKHHYYPNVTIWYKGDDWYFEQDEKNSYLYCQYDRVWSVFEREYGGNYTDIQSIIKSLMERHYNLGGLTPTTSVFLLKCRWKDITI